MRHISPKDGYNYRCKSEIFLPALKGGSIIAGGLFLFNRLVDVPGIGDTLVSYRRTMHRFFRTLGGPKFTDRHWMDAGAMSLIDAITISGFTLIAGRLGLLGGGQKALPPGVADLQKQDCLEK